MAAYFARIRESLSGSAKQTPTRRYGLYFLFAALAASVLIGAWLWLHRQPVIHILATISLTGPGSYYGAPVLDGVRLAIEEANASGEANFELGVMDDQSSSDRARKLGGEICESPAIVTLGPVLTTAALASGPVFEKCGLVSILPTAHGDVPKTRRRFRSCSTAGRWDLRLRRI